MCLFDLRPGALPAFYCFLELTKLFLDFTGSLAVRPEIRRQGLPLQSFDFFFFGG